MIKKYHYALVTIRRFQESRMPQIAHERSSILGKDIQQFWHALARKCEARRRKAGMPFSKAPVIQIFTPEDKRNLSRGTIRLSGGNLGGEFQLPDKNDGSLT